MEILKNEIFNHLIICILDKKGNKIQNIRWNLDEGKKGNEVTSPIISTPEFLLQVYKFLKSQ